MHNTKHINVRRFTDKSIHHNTEDLNAVTFQVSTVNDQLIIKNQRRSSTWRKHGLEPCGVYRQPAFKPDATRVDFQEEIISTPRVAATTADFHLPKSQASQNDKYIVVK